LEIPKAPILIHQVPILHTILEAFQIQSYLAQIISSRTNRWSFQCSVLREATISIIDIQFWSWVTMIISREHRKWWRGKLVWKFWHQFHHGCTLSLEVVMILVSSIHLLAKLLSSSLSFFIFLSSYSPYMFF